MKMMQRIQENLSPWWGFIITTLLGAIGILVSVCVFFILKVYDKIDYNYEHAVKQEIINEQTKEDRASIIVRLETFERAYNLHTEKENERHWELKNDIRNIQLKR